MKYASVRPLWAKATPEQRAEARRLVVRHVEACDKCGVEPAHSERVLIEALEVVLANSMPEAPESQEDFYTKRSFEIYRRGIDDY